MPETAPSSVPAIFSALHGLIKEAASELSPQVAVFANELRQYEPGRYVMITKIHGPRYEWESIGGVGFFALIERYEIAGKVTVFNGESPDSNDQLALETLTETFGLFQTCVMTPFVTHRNQPILGAKEPAGVTTFLSLPLEFDYNGGVGSFPGGGEGGWEGVLDWQFSFEAKVAATAA